MATERCSITTTLNHGGELLLTEQEWLARAKHKVKGHVSNSGGGKNKGKQQQGSGRGSEVNKRESGDGRDMSKIKCYNCNKNGHFSRDCTEPRKERKEKANLARDADGEEDKVVFLADLSVVTTEPQSRDEHVLLNEEKSQAGTVEDGGRYDMSWYLDTGASNHMSGRREILSELDIDTTRAVKLGDG